MNRRAWLAAVIVLAAVLTAPFAQSQSYPTRPIKLLVGFPPGGSTDLSARALADKLSQVLGQPVVVDNKPGASGNIAAEYVARAAPDGYILLLAATSFASAPTFTANLGWDPVQDFSPVGMVGAVPIMAVVNPAVPARTLQELIAYSKVNPGNLNVASPGAATLTRLSAEMFKQTAGLDWVTVHYKGGGPAMQDLLAGSVQVMFASISEVVPLVKSGRLRAIAVTTPKRSAVLPEVPTFAESGYPDFSVAAWQAVVGPAGMPKEVIERLNRDIVQVMSTPDMRQRFLAFGTDVTTSTPGELHRFLAAEVVKFAKIGETLGEKVK